METQHFADIEPLIGNTPLLEIKLKYKGIARRVFAKAEYFNLTGSIKDRVALYIMKKAYETGEIAKNDIIAEATSGNTGIAFSAIGSYLGHKVRIYMPDWMSRERITLMQSFGAEVVLVSREQGGFLGSIAMTEELGKKGGVFLPRQFSNEDNINAHIESTGEEIINQLSALGVVPDGVVAGVGTGGTIMGLARSLRTCNSNCSAHPLEPANSPTLSTGYKVGKHRIQGISDEFIPSILKLDELDSVVSVSD
ncbi:MAG: cysteine synthase family protein, partial [Clostridia bacterium]